MLRLSPPCVVRALLCIVLVLFLSASSVAGMASAIPIVTHVHAQGKPCLPGENEGALICYTPAERATAEAQMPEPPVNPDAAVSQTTGLTLTGIAIELEFSSLAVTATSSVAGINYTYGNGLGNGLQGVIVSEHVFDEPMTDTGVLTGTRVTTDTETDSNNGVSVVNIRGWSFVANLFARHLSLSVGSSQSLAVVEAVGNALVQEAGGMAATMPPTTTTTTAAVHCLLYETGTTLGTGDTCYTPAYRAEAEARMPEPPVTPDAAVLQTVGLPLIQVVVHQDLEASTAVTVTFPATGPVTDITYRYGPADPSSYVTVVETVGAPTQAGVVVRQQFTTQDGQTTSNGWTLTGDLPGHNLTLTVEAAQEATVRAVGEALRQQAANSPAPPTMTPTVTPTATATATVTPTTPGATVLPLTITATVPHPDTVLVIVRTAAHARVNLVIRVLMRHNVAVSAHVVPALTDRWATVGRQQGTADASGQLVRTLHPSRPLKHSAQVQLVVTARTATGTTGRTMTVRLR